MKDDIPLERGLTYFYENEEEFSRKGYPVEKQVALAFEAGLCLGQCERKNHESKPSI
jgi:hypothetical protein